MTTSTASKIAREELTFGVEIECAGLSPADAAFAVRNAIGGNQLGNQVVLADGRKWSAVSDGSVHTDACIAGGEGYGCSCRDKTVEVVTPILTLVDLPDLRRVLNALKEAGAYANSSCGLHVHVGTQKLSLQALLNVVNYVHRREDLFIASFGVSAKRLDQYTKPMAAKLVEKVKAEKPRDQAALADAWYSIAEASHYSGERYCRCKDCDPSRSRRISQHYDNSRYHGLNLHSLFYQNRGTIEFRYFNGTVEEREVSAYVQFALALVARCANMAWVSPERVGIVDKQEMRAQLAWMGLDAARFASTHEVLTSKLPARQRRAAAPSVAAAAAA